MSIVVISSCICDIIQLILLHQGIVTILKLRTEKVDLGALRVDIPGGDTVAKVSSRTIGHKLLTDH